MKLIFLAPSGNIATISITILGTQVGASVLWRDPHPCDADVAAANQVVVAEVTALVERQGFEVGTVTTRSQYFEVDEREEQFNSMRRHLGEGLG